MCQKIKTIPSFLLALSALALAPAALSDPLAAGSEASCTNGFPVIMGPGDNVFGPNGSYSTGGGDSKNPKSSTGQNSKPAGATGATSAAAPANPNVPGLNNPPKPGYGGGSVGAAASHSVSAQVHYCYSSSESAKQASKPWAAKPYIPPPRVTTMTHEDDLSGSGQ